MKLNGLDNCGLEKYIQRILRITDDILDGKKKIVMFGAGENGIKYSGYLEAISIKIDVFVDNNKSLWGRCKNGYEIIGPDELREKENFVVLISFSVKKTLDTVALQCERLGIDFFFDDILFYLLRSAVNHETQRMHEIIKSMYLMANDSAYLHMSILSPDIVTTRCTLKCRDCILRIPYVKEKGDADCAELLADMNRALEIIDTVKLFDVCGGETFLYRDLIPFLQQVKKEPRIFSIRVTTSGTVIPSREIIDELRQSNVEIKISDYGELSRKKEELLELFRKEGIPCQVQDFPWYDLTPDVNLNYTENELKVIFDECELKDGCIRNFHGRIFRCGNQEIWRVHELIPEAGKDADLGVDLNDRTDDAALKERLRDYLNSTKPFDICRYCKGKSARLPRAIQL